MAKSTTTLMQKKYINDITVDDLLKNHKVEYIHKFQQALINNPSKSKKVVCDIAGVSNNTLTRYMKDLGMKSFYRHNHKINRKVTYPMRCYAKKDGEIKQKIQEKAKINKKGGTLKERSSAFNVPLKPEDITDEYINKLIN